MKITIYHTKVVFEFPDAPQSQSSYSTKPDPFDNRVVVSQSSYNTANENMLSFTKTLQQLLEANNYGTFFKK
ncbi:MAG: hypothetical protein LBH59_07855 [Planctomycetaceae bacterium]|jgi:hypothetical protein|nr:hypothetical protein [Planctomycetaceae bacterium]